MICSISSALSWEIPSASRSLSRSRRIRSEISPSDVISLNVSRYLFSSLPTAKNEYNSHFVWFSISARMGILSDSSTSLYEIHLGSLFWKFNSQRNCISTLLCQFNQSSRTRNSRPWCLCYKIVWTHIIYILQLCLINTIKVQRCLSAVPKKCLTPKDMTTSNHRIIGVCLASTSSHMGGHTDF